jgi:hypothetical protein
MLSSFSHKKLRSKNQIYSKTGLYLGDIQFLAFFLRVYKTLSEERSRRDGEISPYEGKPKTGFTSDSSIFEEILHGTYIMNINNLFFRSGFSLSHICI